MITIPPYLVHLFQVRRCELESPPPSLCSRITGDYSFRFLELSAYLIQIFEGRASLEREQEIDAARLAEPFRHDDMVIGMCRPGSPLHLGCWIFSWHLSGVTNTPLLEVIAMAGLHWLVNIEGPPPVAAASISSALSSSIGCFRRDEKEERNTGGSVAGAWASASPLSRSHTTRNGTIPATTASLTQLSLTNLIDNPFLATTTGIGDNSISFGPDDAFDLQTVPNQQKSTPPSPLPPATHNAQPIYVSSDADSTSSDSETATKLIQPQTASVSREYTSSV